MRMALLRESSLTAARMAASAASLRLSASMTTVWSHPHRGARWEIRVIEEWRRERGGGTEMGSSWFYSPKDLRQIWDEKKTGAPDSRQTWLW
jgi:hypothetical protein